MSEIIACICEGSFETAIMDRLLEWNCLIFDRSELLDRQLLGRRYLSGNYFEKEYLVRSYEDGIKVIRILDSKKKASEFKLSKPYDELITVINAITNPEIEMIYIISEKRLTDYNRKFKGGKKSKKPSIYVKEVLRCKNIKRYDFVYNYYSDKMKLLKALKRYNSYSNSEMTIYSLVKESCKKNI